MNLSPAQAVKKKVIEEIAQKIEKSRGMIFFEYHGLKVDEINALRASMSEGESEIKVYKNSLFKRALEKASYKDGLSESLKGPLACVFTYKDMASSAKTLVGFKKADDEAVALKAGVLVDRLLTIAEIKEISKLPPREVLLAQLVGTFAATTKAFVTVLSAVPRDFVYAVRAIKDKKEQS